ncbi:FAD:protein FMN transferase [Caenimonas aquaedulcis]|uniref:FAD:protein FMN transferase n=1 Tax=Caenimonas aquaedulcis TaxID=2793270 RepID=A0A931H7D7_9BURK|nr:FAD:protein FMN transferase [Caenimonas aquaedulcis]MBG9389817.1 FAD:protein FMN transferase [Caenimonas aquaedulcis]
MPAWRALRFDFTAMASPCELVIEGRDEPAMRAAAAAAIDEVRRIEAKYSRYLPGSVLSRINAAAGARAVDIDAETSSLLDFAGTLWETSGGLFDATSGVLRRAWNFAQARLPRAGELDALLPLVGWDLVERGAASVRLPLPGMELDFGGFGKEYAADRAAGILHARGMAHALVNLGGDVHVAGPHGLPDAAGQPWQVAIARPRPGPPGPLATIPVLRGGVATSGDYERYFEQGGRRYCHVLEPRTGWPVQGWQSISVWAPNTTAAGALCTVALLKQQEALDWLDGQDAGYLAVRSDGEVFRRAAGTQ